MIQKINESIAKMRLIIDESDLSVREHQALIKELDSLTELVENRFTSVGAIGHAGLGKSRLNLALQELALRENLRGVVFPDVKVVTQADAGFHVEVVIIDDLVGNVAAMRTEPIQLTMRPDTPMPEYFQEKRKGHEPPFKYHR